MSDAKSIEAVLMERINKLTTTVETLNTERKQLLDTNASQQQTISSLQQTITSQQQTIDKLTTTTGEYQKQAQMSNTVVKPIEESAKPLTLLTEEEKLKIDNDMLSSIAKQIYCISLNTRQWGNIIYMKFSRITHQDCEYVRTLLGINKPSTKSNKLELEDMDTYHYNDNSKFYMSYNTFIKKFSKFVPFMSSEIKKEYDAILDKTRKEIKSVLEKYKFTLVLDQHKMSVKCDSVLTNEQVCFLMETMPDPNVNHSIENNQSVFDNLSKQMCFGFLRCINN